MGWGEVMNMCALEPSTRLAMVAIWRSMLYCCVVVLGCKVLLEFSVVSLPDRQCLCVWLIRAYGTGCSVFKVSVLEQNRRGGAMEGQYNLCSIVELNNDDALFMNAKILCLRQM